MVLRTRVHWFGEFHTQYIVGGLPGRRQFLHRGRSRIYESDHEGVNVSMRSSRNLPDAKVLIIRLARGVKARKSAADEVGFGDHGEHWYAQVRAIPARLRQTGRRTHHRPAVEP